MASASVIDERGRDGTRRGGEGDEERVALRVHFNTVVAYAGFANEAAVLRECLRVRVGTELVEQLRRALDVGEEERDGARREIRAHSGMMVRA